MEDLEIPLCPLMVTGSSGLPRELKIVRSACLMALGVGPGERGRLGVRDKEVGRGF